MKLIPVVIKRRRLSGKPGFWGGLLNPAKHYYVKRVESNTNPMSLLNNERTLREGTV